VHGLLRLDPRRFSSPTTIQEWTSQADEILPDDISTLLNEIGEPRLYGWSEPRDHVELVALRLGVVVEKAAVQPIDPTRMLVAACLEDGLVSRQGAEFESVWTGYLRLYNLFQFLPSAIFVSREGLTAGAYTALRLKPAPAPAVSAVAAPSDEWEAVRSVTHPDIHGLLAQLEAQACPVSDVGYELVDAAGAIVATAELGWPTLQIAFLADEEREYESIFTSAGWRTFPLTELQMNGEAAAAVFTSPDAAALP
jgi:DEAD/DEAH box helicase domain-containing protein